jgi:hypothetical protein
LPSAPTGCLRRSSYDRLAADVHSRQGVPNHPPNTEKTPTRLTSNPISRPNHPKLDSTALAIEPLF